MRSSRNYSALVEKDEKLMSLLKNGQQHAVGTIKKGKVIII